MHSNRALIKKELQLFTLDEQIEIINFKINKLEKIKEEQVLLNELIKKIHY